MFGDIANEIRESALNNSDAYLDTYLKHEQELIGKISAFNGIKSEFYCFEVESLHGIAKFLSIFSDFTSVFTLPSSKEDYKVRSFSDNHPLNIDRHITVTGTLAQSSLTQGFPIIPGYLFKNDEDTKKIIKAIDPFLLNGQFLIRPMRTLIVHVSDVPNPNKINYELYYANSDTPVNHWYTKEINEKDSFVIDNAGKNIKPEVLFEITVPYFENIPIEILANILNDEQDLISKFRASLKAATKEIERGDRSRIQEFRNDVIRPEIERLNRKFRTIVNIHKFNINVTLSAFALSFIALQIDAATNFQSLFKTVASASPLGFLASETYYQTEVDKLKDNPYFLLWRINRASFK